MSDCDGGSSHRRYGACHSLFSPLITLVANPFFPVVVPLNTQAVTGSISSGLANCWAPKAARTLSRLHLQPRLNTGFLAPPLEPPYFASVRTRAVALRFQKRHKGGKRRATVPPPSLKRRCIDIKVSTRSRVQTLLDLQPPSPSRPSLTVLPRLAPAARRRLKSLCVAVPDIIALLPCPTTYPRRPTPKLLHITRLWLPLPALA
ncbi:hypothetical protein MIND_01155200 [Mycena indigotica]|uniref:Uncharacterized protein n=1 Tax=Mycena indigotica TaxID=2126181 RepID=A0A8H6VWD3_9AGAR|nr:uncharacterized protein MIND_01154700 [Mycena indigotica]XP_037215006.1 uncharacterized protein MIND_01155200 [Mycena indigotica]KAF7292574.1 hypothetical protein MIND_01154700 [Mycena indigotica]KAF7292578.1 hypothetical protein MIND_01155200 [Mycena indigotica]